MAVNLLDMVMSRSGRMAAPLAAYPGVRLIGRPVSEALHHAPVQLRALRALEERLRPDIVFPLLDLTVEAECMGLGVDFHDRQPPSLAEKWGPRLERLYEMGPPDPEEAGRMPVFLEVAEGMAAGGGRMSGAYVTAPLALLAQLLGSEELLDRIRLGDALTEPLAFATSVVGEYAAALAARVDVVLVVDPAAEALRAGEYSSLYRPYVSALAGIVRSSGALCLLHVCGDCTHLLEELSLTGAEGISLGSRVNLARELGKMPTHVVVLGNIDPRRVLRRGTPEDVRWEVRRLLRHTGKARNFVLSTGCDVPADAPLRNLEAMMEEARSWRPRGML